MVKKVRKTAENTHLIKYLFIYLLLKKLLEHVCEKMKIFMVKIWYRKKGKLLPLLRK